MRTRSCRGRSSRRRRTVSNSDVMDVTELAVRLESWFLITVENQAVSRSRTGRSHCSRHIWNHRRCFVGWTCGCCCCCMETEMTNIPPALSCRDVNLIFTALRFDCGFFRSLNRVLWGLEDCFWPLFSDFFPHMRTEFSTNRG